MRFAFACDAEFDQTPGAVSAAVIHQDDITFGRDGFGFFQSVQIGEETRERVLKACLLIVAGDDKRNGGWFGGAHVQISVAGVCILFSRHTLCRRPATTLPELRNRGRTTALADSMPGQRLQRFYRRKYKCLGPEIRRFRIPMHRD